MIGRWNIRSRVLLLALAPATVILVVLTTFMTYLRVAETESGLQQRGAALARHVAKAAEFGLFSGDRSGLQNLADGACKEPDVSAVLILDARAQTMAESRSPTNQSVDTAPLLYIESVRQSLLRFSDLPETPELAAGTKLGEVRIEMSTVGTEQIKRTQWLIAVLIGLVCLAAATGLALLTGRSVTVPIQQMAVAIGKIGDGHLQERLTPAAGGELRSLAQGINQMATALQISQKDLEERIAQATRQLQAQMEAAEGANQAKSRFLAAASHDLRQPLHAIELFAAALRRKARGYEMRELCEKLEESIASMDSLFNSLLDVYRLDSGVLQPTLRSFPIQELFRSLEAEFRGEAAARGLRLRLIPSSKFVRSDPMLLRRILANLIGNALRYTQTGSVAVTCRRDAAGYRIEVRDSGPGIEPDEQKRIFQEFYRIESTVANDGRGLGLAIVARIAALLQTEIRIRSQVGRGSVFSIIVPRGPDALAADLPANTPRSVRFDSPLAVLVIDDDPLVLQSTVAVMGDWSVNVATASNLEQARHVMLNLRQGAVLVLCDLWLSEHVNGIEVLCALKTQWPGDFYGVVVTGDARTETLQMIEKAGYPVLNKPVSAARLRATYTHFLAKSTGDQRRGDAA